MKNIPIYHPEERVLEDYDNNLQTKFGVNPYVNEAFELIEPRIFEVKVKIKDLEGKVFEEMRWVSVYKITLGDQLPFEAGIIANYQYGSEQSAAYRVISSTEGVVDYLIKKK